MRARVEVGGWEHACCGPAWERGDLVDIRAIPLGADADGVRRFIETRHDTEAGEVPVRGRVTGVAIVHPDGRLEEIERLPSGRALRGFDEQDDGHRRKPWTGDPVTTDSEDYLITLG